MIKPSIHNVIVIGGIAVIFILVLRKLAQTGLANVPVLGQVLQLGAAA